MRCTLLPQQNSSVQKCLIFFHPWTCRRPMDLAGFQATLTDYRPIWSLLPLLNKLLERHFYRLIIQHHILSILRYCHALLSKSCEKSAGAALHIYGCIQSYNRWTGPVDWTTGLNVYIENRRNAIFLTLSILLCDEPRPIIASERSSYV